MRNTLEECKERGYARADLVRGRREYFEDCKRRNVPYISVRWTEQYAYVDMDLITCDKWLAEGSLPEQSELKRKYSRAPMREIDGMVFIGGFGCGPQHVDVPRVDRDRVDELVAELYRLYETWAVAS